MEFVDKLKPIEDAYGQEIWSFFNGRKSFEIVEREDGYFDVSYGASMYFSQYDDWSEHQKRAIEFAKGRILDIGCGAGRHSIYLQSKGLDVTGIDSSPLAIRVSRLRGLKKAKVMPIAEIGEFRPRSFDTILMLGNNFGLFGSFNNARLLLRKLDKITFPNAIIIAETNDPYRTENKFHLLYQKFNRKRGRMAGQMRIRIRYMKYVGRWFDYLIVSREEMKEILKGTGWKVKKFIDSSSSPYAAIIQKQTSSSDS
jgi:2-polyprenyl-3-methyl-5-hydroxy-6-metoxy-1,4-benzoquinol methylase